MMKYIKAITAALASFAAVLAMVATDENITFEEINVVWAAGVAFVTAVATAISPRNKEGNS